MQSSCGMNPGQYSMKKKKIDKKLIARIAFFVAIIGLGFYVIRDSWGDIWQQLKVTPFGVVLGVSGLAFVYYLCEAASITCLIRKCGESYTYIRGLGTGLYMGFFRVVTFGSGTAAGGMYYTKQKGVPLSKSLGVFTISYLFQRIVVVVYFVVAYLLNFQDVRWIFKDYEAQMLMGIGLALLISTGLFLFCVSKKIHSIIFFVLEHLPGKERFHAKLTELEDKSEVLRTVSVEILKDKKVWLKLFLTNTGKLTAWYLMPCVIYGFSAPGDVSNVICITSIMYALAGVIPAPGGVGAIEFLFTLFFTKLVGHVKAVSGAIIFRVATYFIPAIWGFVVFWGLKTRQLREDMEQK